MVAPLGHTLGHTWKPQSSWGKFGNKYNCPCFLLSKEQQVNLKSKFSEKKKNENKIIGQFHLCGTNTGEPETIPNIFFKALP